MLDPIYKHSASKLYYSGEEDFKSVCVFSTVYGYGGYLVKWCGTFEHTVNIPTTEAFMYHLVKIGQTVSEKTFKDYAILYMHLAQDQGQITPGDKILIVTDVIPL